MTEGIIMRGVRGRQSSPGWEIGAGSLLMPSDIPILSRDERFAPVAAQRTYRREDGGVTGTSRLGSGWFGYFENNFEKTGPNWDVI